MISSCQVFKVNLSLSRISEEGFQHNYILIWGTLNNYSGVR